MAVAPVGLARIDVPRLYALAVTFGFLASGIVASFTSHGLETQDVLIFPMNLPHGLLHLVIGSLGIYALVNRMERRFAGWMALALTVLFLAGYLPQPLLGVLPVGGTDMFLHGLAGVLGEATVRVTENTPARTG